LTLNQWVVGSTPTRRTNFSSLPQIPSPFFIDPTFSERMLVVSFY
jgi:hypothetical protein